MAASAASSAIIEDPFVADIAVGEQITWHGQQWTVCATGATPELSNKFPSSILVLSGSTLTTDNKDGTLSPYSSKASMHRLFQTFSTMKTEPSTKMQQLLETFPILSTNLIVGTTHIKLCAKLLSCVSLTNKTQTLWLTSMWSGPSIPSRLPLQLSYCLTESPTASPPSSTMPQELIDLMTTQLQQTSNHSTTSSTPPLSGSISSSSKLDTFESKQEPITPPASAAPMST